MLKATFLLLSQFSIAWAACDGFKYLTYPKPLLSPVTLFLIMLQYSISPYTYKSKKKWFRGLKIKNSAGYFRTNLKFMIVCASCMQIKKFFKYV
jgi:hypothetical protein